MIEPTNTEINKKLAEFDGWHEINITEDSWDDDHRCACGQKLLGHTFLKPHPCEFIASDIPLYTKSIDLQISVLTKMIATPYRFLHAELLIKLLRDAVKLMKDNKNVMEIPEASARALFASIAELREE